MKLMDDTVQNIAPTDCHPVFVGRGARHRLGPFMGTLEAASQTVLIADQHVLDLHPLDFIGPHLTIAVRPGEASKSLSTAGRLFAKLAAASVDRHAVVVTWGGGMISDLGGFVAATWMRGLRVIHVPTTLESAIDAALGGKTALNLPAGKNLVGVFHQPSAVFIDPDFLSTLPDRDLSAGLAESVKHGAVADPGFLDWQRACAADILARGPQLTELVRRNCRIKLEIVRDDPTERGRRVILNYGHTIGHAIEQLLGYELRHGECVALGMRAENEIAVRRGLLDPAAARALRELLECYGLPARLPRRIEPEQIVAACRIDKKNRGGAIACVLLSAPGVARLAPDVAPAEIVLALEAIQPSPDRL